LESRLVNDVQRLMQAYSNNGKKIVFAVNVLIDRIPGFSSSKIPGVGNFYTAKSFVFGETGTAEDVKDWAEPNMDDPVTLAAFLKQGMCKYPAQKYMLFMSGRGKGIRGGFGGDTSSLSFGMPIEKLVEGLKVGLAGKKLSLMAVDGSMMQHFGVARAVMPYTYHFIASQDVAPGFGSNFKFMRDIFKMNAVKLRLQLSSMLAKTITEKIFAASRDSTEASLSSVRTFRMKLFTVKFDEFLQALRCDLASTTGFKAKVGIARMQAQEIFTAGAGGLFDSHYIDMGTMLDHVADGYTYQKGEEECTTTWGWKCKFPFIYKGDTHNECTFAHGRRKWCSTKTDENNKHVVGVGFNWGNCADQCSKGTVDAGHYFNKETRAKARLAKRFYDWMFEAKKMGATMEREKASGMSIYWPAACTMGAESYRKTKLSSPEFAKMLVDVDHANGCLFPAAVKPAAPVCPKQFDRPCVTTKGTACVFPFTYKPPQGGEPTIYTRCTNQGVIGKITKFGKVVTEGSKTDKPWCSFRVDDKGKHVTGSSSKNSGECSDSCTGQCEENCVKCDMMSAATCTICGNFTYLHNSSCVNTCPTGFTGVGAARTNRICQRAASGRLLADTSSAGQTLTQLQAGTTNATLGNGVKVTAFMINSTTSSKGSLTHATALLGKSLDGKTITWLVEQQAWFPDNSELLFGSVRDASMTFIQKNDGTPGSCDRSQAVFCRYGLVYSTECPLGKAGCKPAEITCKVPVIYKNDAAGNKAGINGTITINIDPKSGEATTVTLLVNQVIIPKTDLGTISPAVWKTKIVVGNFHKEKQFEMTESSFDWGRKMKVSLFPAMQGATTYLALVGVDGFSNPAAVVTPAPAYTSRSAAPVFSEDCTDAKSKQVKVTGTMKFAVEGLSKTHVEVAAKNAIAASLDVSPKLVTVSANKEVAAGRRLADSWAVSYQVTVPEAKGLAVEAAAKAVSADSTAFTKELVKSLESVAASEGVAFEASSVTVSSFTAPAKTNCPVGGCTTAKPTVTKPTVTQPTGGTKAPIVTQPDKSSGASTTVTTTMRARASEEGTVVDASTSLLLSSAVTGLVLLVGSM